MYQQFVHFIASLNYNVTYVLYFQGGKDGNMPTVAEIFKETRQQKSGRLDDESTDKPVIQPAGLITFILSFFKDCNTS